jgi:hypothetical protein
VLLLAVAQTLKHADGILDVGRSRESKRSHQSSAKAFHSVVAMYA